MHLTVLGSGDLAGIPVHGCLCTLCRQARAVRHLRRLPGCLQLESHGERLLIDAGIADLGKRLWQDPASVIVLTSWHPPRWHGLIPVHLGNGPEISVFGPASTGREPWLSQHPGRLTARAELRPGQETLAGRFRILGFALDPAPDPNDQRQLAYGIRDGEQRLAYLPGLDRYDSDAAVAIAAWQPDVVVAGCPTQGSPRQRLEALKGLHKLMGQPVMLLTGLDHHMDHWLASHDRALPDGIRLAHDQQRLETGYLAEYQRLSGARA